MGLFSGKCIAFKSYLLFWAYSKMPAMLNFGFVAQNDGPMADNEKKRLLITCT